MSRAKPLPMKRILITGGAGFIGTALVPVFLKMGYSIRVFDNLSRNILSKTQISHPNLEIIKGDVRDYQSVRDAMRDVQIVVHCAAIAGIDTVIQSPTNTVRVNLQGTLNVLEAAHEVGGIELLINFSTSEVYGNYAWAVGESHSAVTGSVGEARWSYAVGKLAGEHIAHAYFLEHKLPVVTVRPFNIYGPGQVGEGAIHAFVRKAIKDEDLTINGEGNQIRAWCYIDDFVDAIRRILVCPEAIGESFNIGNARAVVTVYGLAEAVIRVTGSKSRILFEPARSVDIELRVPKVEKAQRVLGFTSKVDLEEGIQRTAEYYRSISQ